MMRDGVYEVLVFPETHIPVERTSELLNDWDATRYKAVAAPARPSKVSKDAGGIAMGVQKHCWARSLREMASDASQQQGLRMQQPTKVPGCIDFHDFVAMKVVIKSTTLLIIGVYLDNGIGVTGTNRHKLAHIGTLAASTPCPWLAVGDWNCTPRELEDAGWLEQVKGTVLTPANTSYTCTAGQKRMLDYVVASESALHIVESVKADFDPVLNSGRSHFGIEVTVRGGAKEAEVRELNIPRKFTQAPLPKKKPQEQSKRARKAKSSRPIEAGAAEPPNTAPKKGRPLRLSPPPQLGAKDADEEADENEEGDDCGDHPSLVQEGEHEMTSGERSVEEWTADTLKELWLEEFGKAGKRPARSWAKPSKEVAESKGYQLAPERATEVGASFGRWITAVEEYHIKKLGIPETESKAFRGRAKACRLICRKVKRHKCEKGSTDPGAHWWLSVAFVLQELASDKAQSESRIRLQLVNRTRALAIAVPVSSVLHLTEAARSKWRRALERVGDTNEEDLQALAAKADSNATMASKVAAEAKLKSFRSWILEQDKDAPGKLHRMVKEKPAVVNEVRQDGLNSSDPKDYIDAKRHYWFAKWASRPGKQEKVKELYNVAKERAVEKKSLPRCSHRY